MNDYWINEAVFNNVAWCTAVAASHGISTTRNEYIWLSEHPMPRFYPNIISLKTGALINDHIDGIAPQLPTGWGIKDSYSELELDEKGFRIAFDALWYCRLPNQTAPEVKNPYSRFKVVNNSSELNRWIAAWGEGDGILNSTLLENDSIELVYIERDGEIVSGMATNQSGDSVGISNLFGATEDILYCVSSVVERHSLKGIVGYGDQTELLTLSKIGFKGIGNLRVWLSS